MKKISIFVLGMLLILLCTQQSHAQVRVKFGYDGMTLAIGEEARIPVYIIAAQNGTYSIGSFCLPLASKDEYFSARNGAEAGDDTENWDEISYGGVFPDEPQANYTSQSVFGIFDTGGPQNDTLRITRPGDTLAYVGDLLIQVRGTLSPMTRTNAFLLGDDFYQPTNVCGAQGNSYTISGYVFPSSVVFIAPICDDDSYHVGQGTGTLGNTYNHVDSRCDNGLRFILKDCSRGRYFTDPINGHPHRYRGCRLQDAYSILTCVDTEAESDIAANDEDDWNDGGVQAAAVDAHVYAGLVYDCMYQDLGRNSFDGNGAANIISVADSDLPGLRDQAAFYYPPGSVHYGPGFTPGWRPLSCCIDIVAHEWGHGITTVESNLPITFILGAMNESFSDLFAAYVTSKKVGSPSSDIIWSIGEDHEEHNFPIRRMDFPELRGNPSVYHGIYWYWGNNGDSVAHTNCGVPNKMSYLLSEGGENPSNQGIIVPAIGIDNAMKILYVANQDFWSRTMPDSNFQALKDGTFRAALKCEIYENTVQGYYTVPLCKAWNAVGVVKPPCGDFIPGDCDNNGTAGQVADYQFLRNYIENGVGAPHLECPLPNYPYGECLLPIALDVDGSCEVNLIDLDAYSLMLADDIETDDPVLQFPYCPYFFEP